MTSATARDKKVNARSIKEPQPQSKVEVRPPCLSSKPRYSSNNLTQVNLLSVF